MANIQENGLRWWGTLMGGVCPVPHMLAREVANNYGTALFSNMTIKSVNDGTIAAGTASDTVLGVAEAYAYTRSGEGGRRPAKTIPASTTFSPTAVGSPTASLCQFIPAVEGYVWEADGDDATITTLAAAIGIINENVDLVVGSGNATTGLSAETIDMSGHATTATLTWRVVDIVRRPDVDYTVTRQKYLITPNLSEWPSFTATGV